MKRSDERIILLIVVATGISSVVSQLLYVREFLTQFEGNEYVISMILFDWLILGGIGTLLARYRAGSSAAVRTATLGWLSVLIAVLPSLGIFFLRIGRDIIFIHGASVGFYATFAFTFVMTAPYAVLIGFVLPYSLFVLRAGSSGYPGARVYMVDALGDTLGGALFSLILVNLLTPFESLLFINCVLLVVSTSLLIREVHSKRLIIVAVCGVLCVNLGAVCIEENTISQGKGKLVQYKESRFGRIVVTRDSELYTLFVDGMPVTSSSNTILAEEAIHYPLSQLETPQEILLISSVGGMMGEIEKYSPRRVDYVQLDPELARAEFDFGILQNIEGLNLITEDARAYLMRTTKRYDAIVMNVPEPETFQINRFYTEEFFVRARSCLYPGGIVSFSIEGFDSYVSEPLRKKISCLYRTASESFSSVVIVPGQRLYFLCSESALTLDIPGRLDARGISTRYIEHYYHGDVSQVRRDLVNRSIDPGAPINRDESPYLMRLMFDSWFAKHAATPYAFYSALGIFIALYLLYISRAEFVLFSTGFTTMGSEVLVIFVFQIVFGYIYLKLGFIITVFLLGLLPGAFFGERIRTKTAPVLALSDGLIAVVLAILVIFIQGSGQYLPETFFYGVALCVSVLCGFQFPVALSFQGGDNPAAIKSFSADLIGAATGVLVVSVLLIPYLGIIHATVGLILLKVLSILIVVSHGKTIKAKVSLV
ncbi:MAG: hypothetical protein ACP5G0_03915 [Desulfomonilia bacterium]